MKPSTNKTFPEDTTFYVLCGLEPAKYDPNLTIQFEEMSNNLAEKIESCASDMGYSLAPNIVLKTKETGMYILSQLNRGSYFHCINNTSGIGNVRKRYAYFRL